MTNPTGNTPSPDLAAAPGGEVITEEMIEAGYDATRLANGTPQFAEAGFCLGHAAKIYKAMRAVAPSPAAETAPDAGLVEALRDILNPVGALQREADVTGSRLNDRAYSIANSVSFLQDIARRALSRAGAAK